jgi:hypothetical protein
MKSTVLPVAREASDLLQGLVSEGQPVVLNVESYEEAEEAVEAAA